MTAPDEILRDKDPTHRALRERVKELTCLYGIAQVAEKPGITLEELACHVAALLPPAWQYPETATARVTIDVHAFCSQGFAEGHHRLTADIVVDGSKRGEVEVFYLEDRPPSDEGPFCKEERSLLNEVARQLAHVLERRRSEEEKERLQETLRRADRLATIGKLAAGVAHELNEPIGAILGYAELTQQNSFGAPDQVSRNIDQIVKASLHAREIIRNLLLFSRQASSEKHPMRLNNAVRQSLVLLESRCIKSGVKMSLRLAKDLPEIVADPAQIQQVVLNLALNAVQSMTGGGTLRVITEMAGREVRVVVEDTGPGMEPEVQNQVFHPFFTTKDIGQGTGLGLSVVHGIVTGHGGKIHVDATPGQGSRFEVLLPIAAPSAEDP